MLQLPAFSFIPRRPWAAVAIGMLSLHAAGQKSFPEVPNDNESSALKAPSTLEPIPAPPNYGQARFWASLPATLNLDDEQARPRDVAMKMPLGRRGKRLVPLQDEDAVDVFYIHPTMLLEGEVWNANLSDAQMNDEVDAWPLRHQASAFSGAGRIFAPRYRQAHIRIFDLGDSLSWAAAAVAYSDVRSAFVHYLEHWNDGRPILLAGHSQGSFHGRTLLQEFFDGTPLQDQLVAAYLPGMDMYASEFQAIQPCTSPQDVGCLCTWMTYGEGFLPAWLQSKMASSSKDRVLCTHPVTWTCESGTSHKADHLGVVRPSFRLSKPRAVTAELRPEGVLWIQPPHVFGGRLLQRENWHSGDINLFWANVYENAKLRALEWHHNSKGSDE